MDKETPETPPDELKANPKVDIQSTEERITQLIQTFESTPATPGSSPATPGSMGMYAPTHIFNCDIYHSNKRILSFHILDKLLNCCVSGQCPSVPKKVLRYLIDISAESYIDQRAYYDYECGIGSSDDDRYFSAANKLKAIFNCKSKHKLNTSVLDADDSHIHENIDRVHNRKSYWTYKKLAPHNDPVADYWKACEYIDRIKAYRTVGSIATLDEIKRFFKSNLHIVNGIELFKFCDIRIKHR